MHKWRHKWRWQIELRPEEESVQMRADAERRGVCPPEISLESKKFECIHIQRGVPAVEIRRALGILTPRRRVESHVRIATEQFSFLRMGRPGKSQRNDN